MVRLAGRNIVLWSRFVSKYCLKSITDRLLRKHYSISSIGKLMSINMTWWNNLIAMTWTNANSQRWDFSLKPASRTEIWICLVTSYSSSMLISIKGSFFISWAGEYLCQNDNSWSSSQNQRTNWAVLDFATLKTQICAIATNLWGAKSKQTTCHTGQLDNRA